MTFSSDVGRATFRCHVRMMLELVRLDWPPSVLMVYDTWLSELDAWEAGPPPLPPGAWPAEWVD